MTDAKFWGQYGPGVRRLKGSEELICVDDLQDPKYDTEEYRQKVLRMYNTLVQTHFEHCFESCWRE